MTADDSYGRLDDDDYPAYTMGRAAEILGTTQGFLRAIGNARLITPLRSAGGHRRYSRYQLRSPPAPANWWTRAPPSRPPAASSSWKTNSKRQSASTPNTAAPPKQRTAQSRPDRVSSCNPPRNCAVAAHADCPEREAFRATQAKPTRLLKLDGRILGQDCCPLSRSSPHLPGPFSAQGHDRSLRTRPPGRWHSHRQVIRTQVRLQAPCRGDVPIVDVMAWFPLLAGPCLGPCLVTARVVAWWRALAWLSAVGR
jgi:hypothetical protein